mgnify:FL=1
MGGTDAAEGAEGAEIHQGLGAESAVEEVVVVGATDPLTLRTAEGTVIATGETTAIAAGEMIGITTIDMTAVD